jgi:tRNA (pseudouridine54-N1)-methyltransferase
MRTFILRARKGTTRWEKVRSQVGTRDHFEVVAHTIMNAFFISNGFREDVEIYIVLDSSEDFPRTIKLSGNEGLSIAGFYEEAIVSVIELALKEGQGLKKDETRAIAPGLQISGFGFEKLITSLLKERTVYLLDPKGDDIRSTVIAADPVFVLSDHLAMPKNNVKSFLRRGLKLLSLGKKMLFASQCVVLIHAELDR